MKQLVFGRLVWLYSLLFPLLATAQDTIPKFSVWKIQQNKYQISWVNPFNNTIQLSVQRSNDSLRHFTTIKSTAVPNLENDMVEDNFDAKSEKIFYRIFYVFEDGEYFFTHSQSPTTKPLPIPKIIIPPKQHKQIEADPQKNIDIYYNGFDKLYLRLSYQDYMRFKDSVNKFTSDTIKMISNSEAIVRTYKGKPFWKPSPTVFSNKSGTISIHLPFYKIHRYKIIFFDEDGTELFTIKHFEDSDLLMERANFMHWGWFKFQMYEDDKLMEQNKFFIEKPY